MYCEKCGHPNPDGTKFCSQCGAPMPTPTAPNPGPTPQAYGRPYGTPYGMSYEPPSSNPNLFMVLYGITLGVFVLLAYIALSDLEMLLNDDGMKLGSKFCCVITLLLALAPICFAMIKKQLKYCTILFVLAYAMQQISILVMFRPIVQHLIIHETGMHSTEEYVKMMNTCTGLYIAISIIWAMPLITLLYDTLKVFSKSCFTKHLVVVVVLEVVMCNPIVAILALFLGLFLRANYGILQREKGAWR